MDLIIVFSLFLLSIILAIFLRKKETGPIYKTCFVAQIVFIFLYVMSSLSHEINDITMFLRLNSFSIFLFLLFSTLALQLEHIIRNRSN